MVRVRDRLRRAVGRAKRWLSPDGTVAEQTVKSGVWMAAMNVADRGLQIVMLIVLAGAGAVWLVARLWQAWGFRPSLSTLGLRLERMYPALGGRVASAIEFAS